MRWMIAGVVVLGLVFVGCSGDPTGSEEYQELERQFADAEAALATAESALETAEADVAVTEAAVAATEANETAFVNAWLGKDLDGLMDTYAEDVVFVDLTYGDYVEGKDDYRRMNATVIEFTDPDESRVLDRFVSEDGTRAATMWEWGGTNFFGRPFDLPFVMVNEYRDGKIAKQTIYYASPDAYSQLMGS